METKKEMMGVTFQGSVTFQGPMFDIHDNQQVTIVSRDEQKAEGGEESELGRRLVPLFNREEEAMKFPERIRGLKDKDIARVVNQLWEKGVIADTTTKLELWEVLHDLGAYTTGVTNWNAQVVKP
jgi:hypothetical protein